MLEHGHYIDSIVREDVCGEFYTRLDMWYVLCI